MHTMMLQPWNCCCRFAFGFCLCRRPLPWLLLAPQRHLISAPSFLLSFSLPHTLPLAFRSALVPQALSPTRSGCEWDEPNQTTELVIDGLQVGETRVGGRWRLINTTLARTGPLLLFYSLLCCRSPTARCKLIQSSTRWPIAMVFTLAHLLFLRSLLPLLISHSPSLFARFLQPKPEYKDLVIAQHLSFSFSLFFISPLFQFSLSDVLYWYSSETGVGLLAVVCGGKLRAFIAIQSSGLLRTHQPNQASITVKLECRTQDPIFFFTNSYSLSLILFFPFLFSLFTVYIYIVYCICKHISVSSVPYSRLLK